MEHKIGDIVRFILLPDKTAIVIGYAKGHALSKLYNFAYDDDVVLAMTEKGNVQIFRNGSTDWQVVDHYDMGDVFKHIINAKKMVV